MAQNIELTPSQLQEVVQKVRELLLADSQGVNEVPVVATLDMINSLPAIRNDGPFGSVVKVPLNLLKISLQKTDKEIQWRNGDNGAWVTLVNLDEISGKDIEFRANGYSIEWRYKGVSNDPWKKALDLSDTFLNYYTKTDIDSKFLKQKIVNSQEEYDALEPKDPNTIYFILEE